MHTDERAANETDQALIEAVAASLELPRGAVDDAAIEQWLAGLEANGWLLDERDGLHYLLRHPEKRCRADVQVVQVDADHDDRPVFTGDGPADARYAFSTVRIYGPEDGGLVADANLADAGPDGSVVWLLGSGTPADGSAGATTGQTASANPFHQSLPARLVGVLTARPVLVGLAAGLIIAAVALMLSRRQDDHSNGTIAETRLQRILDRVA